LEYKEQQRINIEMELKNLLFGCYSEKELFISKEIRLSVVNHFAIQKIKNSFSHFFPEATLAIFQPQNIIIDCLIDDIMEQAGLHHLISSTNRWNTLSNRTFD